MRARRPVLVLSRRESLVRASHREPDCPAGLSMQLERVRQLTARALAECRVVTAELVGSRRKRANHRRVLRATEGATSCSGGRSKASRTDDGRPVVGRSVGDRWLPDIPKDQLFAVEFCSIGEVELCLAGRREAPRVRAHKLGMGIHVDLDLCSVGRSESKPELDGASSIGDEVGARDLHAAGRWQRHLYIAEARGEARRWPDPLAVDAEPDTVEQLDWRSPDATHLAAGVKAHRRIAAILAAEVVSAITRGGIAPLVELA